MPNRDFYALLVRLFLGYLLLSAGLCKLTDGHFGQLIGPPWLIKALEPHGLRDYAIFVAASQVVAGALVLSQRWSLLGLVAMVPMHANILAVTVSQRWQGTPYVDAVLLLLNLLALLDEWPTLKFFLLPETTRPDAPARVNRWFPARWLPAGVLLTALAATVTSRFNQPATVALGAVCFVLTYANVWRAVRWHWLQAVILGLSGAAILGVTLAYEFRQSGMNPMLLVAGALGLIVPLLLVSTLRTWRMAKISQPEGVARVGARG